jgi:hypothetical protein
MKKLLFVVLAVLFSGASMAQSNSDNSVVYQNWKMIGESPTHYEVSARVVKCHPDSTVQLHLEMFNEGVGAQACHFKITIINPVTKEQIVKEVNHTLGVGEMIKPSCDNGDKQSLRFNIPSGWNPETLEFTVTFIP